MSITRKYADLDLTMTPHPVTKDVVRKLDEQAVKASLRNLILLNHYECPFNSAKGSGIREMMFELPSPILKQTMERMINDLIINYEPRVEVLNISVQFPSDQNSAFLLIEFKIRNTPTRLVLEMVLERSR